MLNQIKYSARQSLNLRLFALGIIILMNIVFGILGAADLYGMAGKITAATLSSLGLTALFVIAVIADTQSVKSLFSAPAGYTDFLAPVSGWKILAGRIIPIVVFDLVSFAVGVAGVVWQGILLSNVSVQAQDIMGGWSVIGFLMIFVGYLLLITAIFFANALSKTIFFRYRLRGFLSFLGFIAAFYLLGWLDLSLAVFTPVTRFGPVFSLTIYAGLNAATILYIILGLVKTGIVFFAASRLIDRGINI